MRCKKITLAGKVQGVFFRDFVRKVVGKIGGIAGCVKNLKNGNVEIVACGDEKKIEELVKRCRKGPFLADVSSIQQEEVESEEEFDSFFIKY